MLKKTSNRWLMRKQIRNLYVGLRWKDATGLARYGHYQKICTVEGQRDLGSSSTGFYQWWTFDDLDDEIKSCLNGLEYVIVSPNYLSNLTIHGSGNDIENLGSCLRVDIGQQSIGYIFDNNDGVSLATLFGG